MFEIPDSQIRPQLSKDEILLWSGRPQQGVLFRSSDIIMVPFSLCWGGFAVFWEIMAIHGTIRSGAGTPPVFAVVFPLFGIPFVIIGLYLIFGRFIVDAKRRAGSFYGLTNQRIIIVSGIIGRKVKSLNLSSVTDLSLTEKSDGSGTITFGPSNPMMNRFGNPSWPGMSEFITSFELIPGAKDVHEKIRSAQSNK